MKGVVSAQKNLKASETETGELLGGTKENNILPDEGTLIYPRGKLTILFQKIQTE